MTTDINICPACNAQQQSDQNQFCDVCDWELITMSDLVSDSMKKYYDEKLGKHKKTFENNKAQLQVINSITPQNEAFKKEVDELKIELEKLSLIKNINDEFEAYKFTHPDSVIALSGNAKGKAVNIFWEQIRPLVFKFNSPGVEQDMPAKIVMLLKRNGPPQGYGDCNLTILVETKDAKKASKDTIELTINDEFIKPGLYFIRFMNLNYNVTNVHFLHNEQVPGNQQTYISKTLITIA